MRAMDIGHGVLKMNYMPDLFASGLDDTQGMTMNGSDMGMDGVMDGYAGYR
jgi:hypothetical protein